MKHKMKLMGTGVIIFLICAFYCSILTMYVRPMEDLSLDLSLLLADNASPEDFDEKGWTVFTQEGNTVTTLTPDGIGGYTGIELGQTLYFSRVLVEELDNPTLKLGIVDRNFSVFLDGELIYTDCPGLDNRIGYLKLPMREWEVLDPLTISLPANFHGKTLTIAQSTPEYSERPTVKAYPTDVMLYCGYAYESGLIAESYQTAFVAMVVFAVGLLLMLSFLRNRDAGVLSIGLAAFTWMIYLLVDTTYFYRYWGFGWSNLTSLIHPFAAGTLLFFLYTRAGKGKKKLRILLVLYTLTVLFFLAVQLLDIHTNPLDSLSMFLPNWVAFIGFAVILVLGIKYWCRENPFYRLFTPLASAATLLLWTILLLTDDQVGSQIALSLKSGQITYI